MVEISKQALFSAILSSHILDLYLEKNADLAELIRFPDHPDIHYFDSSASVEEIAPTLKRRLAVMVAKSISHNLEATKQLVAFAEGHPESPVYNVTCNCQTEHYGVRCGVVDDQIRVICVMTGGHIPDELLGDATR